MTVIVGVDIGITGAIAFLRDGNIFAVHDLPVEVREGKSKVNRRLHPAGLRRLILDALREYPGEALAVIESQRGMPDMTVQTMHSLGDSFGVTRAVLACLGITTMEVDPRTWKRQYELNSDKKSSIRKASQLFPDAVEHWQRVKDHNRAEASIIAHYGWKRWA